jgi:hypothetical protein
VGRKATSTAQSTAEAQKNGLECFGAWPQREPRGERALVAVGSAVQGAIHGMMEDYICPFGPPGRALARARHGLVNFVPGLASTTVNRAVSCWPTGCVDGLSLGPQACFVPGLSVKHEHK